MAEAASRCARCAEVEQRCTELERRIAHLEGGLEREHGLAQKVAIVEAENRDLRARLNLTSRNSSKPPSSDPPSAPSAPAKAPSGRKQGGQPGHPGAKREPFAAVDVDVREVVRPPRCGTCRKVFDAASRVVGSPEIRQVVEIPAAIAFVTEYTVESLRCDCCQNVTTGELPAGVGGLVGPRLQAALTMFSGKFRLSRREATDAVEALFGPKARISVGWVSELERHTSGALESAHGEAGAAIEKARIAHADETSWPEMNRKGWLWVATTATVAFFLHRPSRGREAAKELLGAFCGILIVDRFASYRHHARRLRQICLAHLKRNFQELVDLGMPAAEIGNAGLLAITSIFEIWEQHQRGEIPFKQLMRRTNPARMTLLSALAKGVNNPDRKAAGMSKDLLGLFDCLWTFARYPGVEPTNNLAERRIRPAVLWRKGSFGTQSERGSRFVERMLTVATTLKLQGRSVLDFIEQAIRAGRTGTTAPRLLPG